MRKLYFTIVMMTILLPGFFAQSVHKYFYEIKRAQNTVKAVEESRIIFPEKVPQRKLSAKVFGFLPDWEYVSDSKKYLRLDLLTHIAVFGFVTDAQGNLQTPLAWPWTDLINAAHLQGVKVVMTVISFDNEVSHNVLNDVAARENLFNNISNIIEQNNLDGVNLDFEGLYEEDRGTPVVAFTQNLKEFLPDANYEVSFDAPAWNWGGWDFPGLASACDYLFVMEYDYFGAWSEVSGPSAPLTGNGINITRSINEQFAGVPHSKIILGIPYYGIHWITADENENSETENFLDYLTYRTVKSGFDWSGKRWSENYSTVWSAWREDSTHQLWYDDVSSLEAKYDFAISENLLGVGIWALGFDGNRRELWSLIEKKFAGGEIVVPEPPVAFYVGGKKIGDKIYAELKFSSSENAQFYWVYESNDGINFDSLTVTDTLVLLERNDLTDGTLHTKYYKVAAANSGGISAYTTTLATNTFEGNAIETEPFLIVDGFDRYYGNGNEFNYITKVAGMFDAYGAPFFSANNEAVIKNEAGGSSNLFWILGNESRATETFNYFEQRYLNVLIDSTDCFPRIFISGSEIGYDLADADYARAFDEEFYEEKLRATYISDAPGGNAYTYYSVSNVEQSAIEYGGTINFDNGTHGTFNVAYPDAILSAVADSLNDLRYSGLSEGNGFAGISYDGDYRLVYLAFPIETVYDEQERYSLFTSAMNFLLDGVNAVARNGELSDKFILYQNYPNPFNPTTTIKYSIPSVIASDPDLSGERGNLSDNTQNQQIASVASRPCNDANVQLIVYDVLGRKVVTLVNEKQAPGTYSVQFDASDLPSGIYFYVLRAGDFVSTRKMILLK